MDITSVFRSRLDVVRNRSKVIGTLEQSGNSSSNTGTKSKIFPGKKSEYYAKARELCATITSLKDYLVENRSAYLNFGTGSLTKNAGVWRNEQTTLSDGQRDKIDSDVLKIIQNCQKKIFEYEKLIASSDIVNVSPQLHTHLDNVYNSLADYLKDVCTVHSEMRAVRVKRTVNYQTMSRLASNNHVFNSSTSQPLKPTKVLNSRLEHDEVDEGSSSARNPAVPSYFDDEISPEELQMFEEENAQLLNELNTLTDEVNQIETSVVQISQLQEIFTEKVLQQDKELDKISTLVVGATENMRGGNEQIRQAIQKNADFRAWVLFFIIVMSFSLLFLDWYND